METTTYGTQTIEYKVHRASRKSLAIEVHPDQSIHVIAPLSATPEAIDSKIIKRGRWIIRQQDYFAQFLPRSPQKEYFSGESHYYLGRRYSLKIRKGKENKVRMVSGALLIHSSTALSNPDKVKALLGHWYYAHSKTKFEDELQFCSSHTLLNLTETPPCEIRRMKNRWGSCTPSGKIILNPEIIKAPKSCLRYVIYHELCHLVVHDHSRRFYRLLDEVMPDWKKAKERLERELA